MLQLSFRRAFVALTLLAATPAFAQSSFHAVVVDEHDGEPLIGVNVLFIGLSRVDASPVGGTTNSDGQVTIDDIPDGSHTVAFSYIGFQTQRLTLTFPLETSPLVVELGEEEHELGEATVQATRTSRTIADTPTRIEVIAGEEIEEKIAMDPSGISMILNESPGIVVQQTSAVSASSTFRIQGLDGRHTQLLRDGFPLYGGLSGGLSILQVPPLDLAQVEVIKGPSSTLYGGGAIAGLVNLVSKQPGHDPDRSILMNATTAGGLDLAAYSAQRGERHGYSVLASGNLQRPYDAEEDFFTNLPSIQRLTLSPTFYYYGAGTLTVRLSGTSETREGGDIDVVRGDANGFSERNTSRRFGAAVGYQQPLSESSSLSIRTSGSLFNRTIDVPEFQFAGRQFASYSEASFAKTLGAHQLVVGADIRTDRFDQDNGEVEPLDYDYNSIGAYVQDTWDMTSLVALEAGLRIDTHNEYGTFVLPRLNAMFRLANGLTARAGGGFGYNTPTALREDAEALFYRGVQPIGVGLEPEKSIGGNVDVNYRTLLGPFAVSINQALYVTRLDHVLLPVEVDNTLSFLNADGSVVARGSETTARISINDFKLFLGYVYLDTERQEGGLDIDLPLTARHRTYSVLVWERHGRGRIGLEAYYTGSQVLPGGGTTPGYLVGGIMAMWRFGSIRAFANLENLLDARQSRTSALVSGPRDTPTFAPIWGPTDGFIANAGVILEL